MNLTKKIKTTLPPWGFGAIVSNEEPWTTPENFVALLDACTTQYGIQYLDTAQRYRDAEKVLGDWISSITQEKIDSLWIGSKIGKKPGSTNELLADYVYDGAKASLSLLNLKQLDIYWLHGVDSTTAWKDTLEGFNRVVQDGLARNYGVCNVSQSDISEILKICDDHHLTRPKFIQNEFNLLQHRGELPVLEVCKKEDLHFTAFSPLAGGILTGKYELDHFPENTRWMKWKNTRGLPDYWTKESFEAIKKLKVIAEEKEISLSALCLVWVHQYDGVKTTLIGPRNLNHMSVVEEAQNSILSGDEMNQVSRLF